MLHRFNFIDVCFLALIILIAFPASIYGLKQKQATTTDYKKHYSQLIRLIGGLIALVISPNFFCLTFFWAILPVFIYPLMQGDGSEPSSFAASYILKYHLLSSSLMVIALCLLPLEYYFQPWSDVALPADHMTTTLFLIAVICSCALMSGLYPAHQWLLHSLSAPTAVSALLHGGVINSSAFILLKITPLITSSLIARLLILTIASVSMVLGAMMAAAQTEQKRALACSTITQMAFVFAQIALGQHAFALAHLVAHAFYKAYSFLGMGLLAHSRKTAIHPKVGPLFSSAVALLGVCFYHITLERLNMSSGNDILSLALFAYFLYTISCYQQSRMLALIWACVLSLLLTIWHFLFHIIIPVQQIHHAVSDLILAPVFFILISYPYWPIRWQQKMYAFIQQQAIIQIEAVHLSRSSDLLRNVKT